MKKTHELDGISNIKQSTNFIASSNESPNKPYILKDYWKQSKQPYLVLTI